MLDYNYYSIDNLEPRRTMATARALARYRFPSCLESFDVPCLLAQAPQDRMHDADLADELARVIPDAELLDVPESGYVHSAEMGHTLLEFFKKHAAERSPD